MENRFDVTFWGVRGTMPTPSAENLQVGGHTSCVQMRCGDAQLIFDAGSGLYPLGEDDSLTDMDLFLSHTHIDHIIGFPFFSPAFRKGTTIRLWAGHLAPQHLTLRGVLDRFIAPPIFPLTLEQFGADLSFHDFHSGGEITAPHLNVRGIVIRTLALNHPDGATGYRIDYKGRSACYITDVEHLRDGLDEQLVAFISQADLLIYDCTFDDRDFDRFVGWGHSTWQQAARLADAAGAARLAVFHHDPNRHDGQLSELESELRAARPNDLVAREGTTLSLLS